MKSFWYDNMIWEQILPEHQSITYVFIEILKKRDALFDICWFIHVYVCISTHTHTLSGS